MEFFTHLQFWCKAIRHGKLRHPQPLNLNNTNSSEIKKKPFAQKMDFLMALLAWPLRTMSPVTLIRMS